MPVPAPVTLGQGRPDSGERLDRLAHRFDRAVDRLAALGRGRKMLGSAVIRLQALEAQMRRIRDPAGEVSGGRSGRDAAALHPDLDLDERPELDAVVARHPRGGVDLLGIIEAQRDLGVLGEPRQASQLRRADDLVADEDVADAGARERFRFRDLLHALADGAERDLPFRDLRAFVGLRVRPEPDTGVARNPRHLLEIALERVEVDDQRRRVDVLDGSSDLSRW